MQQENDESNKVADKHKEEKSDSPSLNMSELRELAELIDEYGLVDFEFENANIRVHMRKQMPHAPIQYAPVAAPAASTAAPAADTAGAKPEAEAAVEFTGHVITSPIVGTFYASPSPEAPPFVKVGDKVKRGQVVCIIEAMKLMNEIESDFDGEVVKIYVDNGQAVEFGQPLFDIS
ncbi:MAG TPA: acetyl-CoA carboxylase biotin carboxyl carrier protein [Pyrinomonadaceae bacterium]|nr:acetyl-CoA carboxylase biotin carboxyl carrier protein [Pyrinomonadaceae bacterium]